MDLAPPQCGEVNSMLEVRVTVQQRCGSIPLHDHGGMPRPAFDQMSLIEMEIGQDAREALAPAAQRRLVVALRHRSRRCRESGRAVLPVSRRTIEYHLHKVFAKLGIRSRSRLERALGGGAERPVGVTDSPPPRITSREAGTRPRAR
jgi:hypothetical protein